MQCDKGLMLMLGLNDTIVQLAILNIVLWYGHVVRRALELVVECQKRKGKPKRL